MCVDKQQRSDKMITAKEIREVFDDVIFKKLDEFLNGVMYHKYN